MGPVRGTMRRAAMAFALACLLPALASAVASELGEAEVECEEYHDCAHCISLSDSPKSCGWCRSEATCKPGNMFGPTGPKNCTMWDYGYCAAEPCALYTACHQCVQDPFCGWCASEGHCVEGTRTGPLFGLCPHWMASGS